MDINNFNDYLIYKDGRVYSKRRNKYLSHTINDKGYVYVNLSINKIRKTYALHRLIAEHYISNPDNYSQVDHFDRNKLNNNIENLRWVSPSINCLNRGTRLNQKHKYISQRKDSKRFRFEIKRYKINKTFKSLTDALCYKYIFLLKLKCNIYK